MNAVSMPETPELLAVQLHQAQAAVEKFPGQTSACLAESTGTDRDVLLARLQDLQRVGTVHAAELTVCRRTGRLASVWRPGRDPLVKLDRGYERALAELAPPDPLSAADVAA